MLTADRIFEQALKHTVSLLGDFAGNGICQHAKTESREIRSVCRIKYRDHKQHHLGMTSILVTSPTQEIVDVPNCNVGNPSPVSVSFLRTVPL